MILYRIPQFTYYHRNRPSTHGRVQDPSAPSWFGHRAPSNWSPLNELIRGVSPRNAVICRFLKHRWPLC
ncbi:hypothetical protein SCLCIDRAFT_701025 [Scleroderma citrinum Foug A]|uniref:Uncharacterized protein n=1 Tax=Scleroderma citrinum Foug A TaxID=1036808 RepID=A0A0C3ENH1_9AGAM|nr:hypothetical protein SCLCIDRAFT_701025 [Scleroderma citrinum Foug A]